jgi:hypothetical protein
VNATVYHIAQDTWNNADKSNILRPEKPSILLSYAHLVTLYPSKQSLLSVASNKEDVLTQSQMLKASDSQCFIQSQNNEIAGLEKFDVMDIHPISSLPKSAKLLSSIWSYRRKHSPNGTLLKHKSRIWVYGKEQAFGQDYWETYAPIASWATIRMLLILSSLMNLKTRQVDYTQAFPHALLEDPVFMRVPQGWFVKNGKLTQYQNPKHNNLLHYLKLKRNLYGCKQVAWNWFKHLTTGLLKQGFIQSKTDSCLFLRKELPPRRLC